MDLASIVATEAEIATKIETLRAALDPERRAAELAEITAPFGPGGPWAYAPKAERVRVEKQYVAAQDRAASIALFHVERATMDSERPLPSLKSAAMRPPSAETAWLQRTDQPGLKAELLLQLETLDELRRARITNELRAMKPSAVNSLYLGALCDPTQQEAACLIRVVENMHGQGWTGDAPDGDAETQAAVTLRQSIGHARQARIPNEIHALEAVIERAKITAGRARKLNGILPTRDDGR